MDKHIDALETKVGKIVNVVLELKKKEKKCLQKKTEIGKRLKKVLVRIEGVSDEGKD